MQRKYLLGVVLIFLLSFMARGAGTPLLSAQTASALPVAAADFGSVHIYFSESSGENSRFDRSDAGLSRLANLLRYFGAEMYTLEWRSSFPSDADLVIAANPSGLNPIQIARLWSYLETGGSLLLMIEPLNEDDGGLSSDYGLLPLMWQAFGVQGVNDIVIVQPGSSLTTDSSVSLAESNPVVAMTTFATEHVNTSHPITANIIDAIVFSTARSLRVDAMAPYAQVTPLVFTADSSYGETGYAEFLATGVSEYDAETDTPMGELRIAAAFADSTSGARLVIIGDSDVATNGFGLQTVPPYGNTFVYPGNAHFMLNAVAWLLGLDPDSIPFSPQGEIIVPGTPASTPAPAVSDS